MNEIIPAIMPDSFKDLDDKVSMVFHYVKTVQVDIMDGKFVPGRTWPYFSSDKHTFQDLLTESEGLPHWDNVDYEIDLMIDKPENVIEDWIVAGAARIIVHIESTQKMDEIIKINQGRIELGIALNIDTPLSDIVGYLEDIQFVQFMGIQTIGLQGQPFDDRVLNKIRELHEGHPEVLVSVDGAVNFETAPLLLEAGVKRFVSGSAIFEGHPADNIRNMKALVGIHS
jgi:ribulose-phosphate 3-epimerase